MIQQACADVLHKLQPVERGVDGDKGGADGPKLHAVAVADDDGQEERDKAASSEASVSRLATVVVVASAHLAAFAFCFNSSTVDR